MNWGLNLGLGPLFSLPENSPTFLALHWLLFWPTWNTGSSSLSCWDGGFGMVGSWPFTPHALGGDLDDPLTWVFLVNAGDCH